MPILIDQLDLTIDPRDPTSGLRRRVAELESRLAALEQMFSVDSDGNITINSEHSIELSANNQIKISATSGVEISTPTTMRLNASVINIGSPMVTSSGVMRANTLMCDVIVATTYTPGAGNIM